MKKHFKVNALQLSLCLLKVYAFSTQANICDLIGLYYGFLFIVEVPIRISLFCSVENNNLAL